MQDRPSSSTEPLVARGLRSLPSGWLTRPALRFTPHVGLLVLVLCGILGTGIYLGDRVIGALPDVGKDLHVVEPWVAPIAVEHKQNGWLVAYVPLCAREEMTGLVLWDDRSQPLWEARGQAFGVSGFLVGAAPAGLKGVAKYTPPTASQVLRLGVFRSPDGLAGVTFRIRDLRDGKVRFGSKWVPPSTFMANATCPKAKSDTTARPSPRQSPRPSPRPSRTTAPAGGP